MEGQRAPTCAVGCKNVVSPWDVCSVVLFSSKGVVKLTGLTLPGFDGRVGRRSVRYKTVSTGP